MNDTPDEMNGTSSENQERILADIWINYKDDPNLKEFISYNDVGLPLAYILSAGIAERTEISRKFIRESFLLLINMHGVEDIGYESFDEILEDSEL